MPHHRCHLAFALLCWLIMEQAPVTLLAMISLSTLDPASLSAGKPTDALV